jgi:hypothetical protein
MNAKLQLHADGNHLIGPRRRSLYPNVETVHLSRCPSTVYELRADMPPTES